MGEMRWMDTEYSCGRKVLHLRRKPTDQWQVYKAFPESVPDFRLHGGESAGFATAQHLLKLGWKYAD